MPKQRAIKRPRKREVVSFLAESAIYAVVVVVYYLLVLHLLGGWLKRLFDGNRFTYAGVALALIVVQGVVLEGLTAGLFKIIRGKIK